MFCSQHPTHAWTVSLDGCKWKPRDTRCHRSRCFFGLAALTEVKQSEGSASFARMVNRVTGLNNPHPRPGQARPGQIVVRMRAVSLNYRGLVTLNLTPPERGRSWMS